jgi:DNA-binding transcriptional LysR family regulator
MNVEARLRAFAAVARQRSFSRAAAELFVSQPAVSKHVASLEAELGTELVVRGRREATLTPAGELLAGYVLRAEALLANAGRALAAGEDGASGTLSIAASGIPGTYVLPELLARFAAELPEIDSTSSSRRRAARSSWCVRTASSSRSSAASSLRPSWRASRFSTTRSCSSGRRRSQADGFARASSKD